MIALLCFFLILFASPFKSKSRLEAENAALRHQLIVLQRRVSGRVQLTNGDRLFLVMLYRWFPSILRPSRSSGQRPFCAGTGPASGDIGGGNPAPPQPHLGHAAGGAGSQARLVPGTVTVPLCSRPNVSPFWIMLLLV